MRRQAFIEIGANLGGNVIVFFMMDSMKASSGAQYEEEMPFERAAQAKNNNCIRRRRFDR